MSNTTQSFEQPEQSEENNTPWWRKAAPIAAAVLAVFIILPLVTFAAGYAVTKVPEPDDIVNDQITIITADDGSTEVARIVPPDGNRENVDLDQIPQQVRDAVLAAEDRGFYTNPGFSFTGFVRAGLGQLFGRDAGGGSTITQQYVKNAVVGNDRSLTRKARELVMSAKMSREWSKDEILQAYLNTIYFGRGAYGIEAASQAYFGKPVGELNLDQGAVLAATIQAPSNLDPWTNPEGAESRWNYVLDGMVEAGTLSQEERDVQRYPETRDPADSQSHNAVEGTNGLIRSRVVDEMAQLGIDSESLNSLGLKVETTIDPVVQASVVDNVDSYMPGYNEDYRAAVVSIDPRTGGVKGYYGGDDPNGFDYANGGMQTGSIFKIFTLAAGLNQNIPLSAQYDSSPVVTGDATVTNVDGESCGTCDIATALKMSLNTSFIRLTKDLKGGPQDVADMAHQLGVAESIPGIPATLSEDGEGGEPYEGITLGQYQSRPLDMASALATLANSGEYYPAHFIQKISDQEGNVIYEHPSNDGVQVVKPAVADNTISAMQPIASYSNGHSLAGGRVSAAKTGTAQLGDTGYNKDAWMIGATPQLATAVWIGSDDGTPLQTQWGGNMYGASLPADIWKGVMDDALVDDPYENFPTPGPIAGQAGAPAPVIRPSQTTRPSEERPSEEPEPEEPSPSPSRPLPGVPDDPIGDLLDQWIPR